MAAFIHRKGETMFVRWLLFETKLGLLFLALLERKVGLAVVDADWLGEQRCGLPPVMAEAK